VAEATVGSLLAFGTDRLREVSPSARLDAELLLARALGVDRARLVIDRDVVVDGPERARFESLVRRRGESEPVAYLLGQRGFRRLDLDVDSRVLVPRPETELLVEVALGLPAGASVLDVGTGSGAIALAVASERPDLVVRGVDVSRDAIAVASRNASRLGLSVGFSVGDLLDGVAGPVDAVLANLPYVADGAALPADVAEFEPALALYGGTDGLDVIRRLVAAVGVTSWPRLLALEIGESQGAAVASLVRDAGFGDVSVRRDLAGLDRVVVGSR
jgi:release factor glutamine methyltransferase